MTMLLCKRYPCRSALYWMDGYSHIFSYKEYSKCVLSQNIRLYTKVNTNTMKETVLPCVFYFLTDCPHIINKMLVPYDLSIVCFLCYGCFVLVCFFYFDCTKLLNSQTGSGKVNVPTHFVAGVPE